MGSVLAPSRADMPCHYRHHHTCQDAAGDNLEEHVGQAVGGVVDVAEAGVSNGLGKDQRPAEADEARCEGEAGDTCGNGSEAGSHGRPYCLSARAAPRAAGAVVTLRETTGLECSLRSRGRVPLIAIPITSGRLPTLADVGRHRRYGSRAAELVLAAK